MLHGPQKGLFDLDFQLPSGCADRLAAGSADIGIIPSFELIQQDLEIIPGAGIACHGAVRSILLVSARPAMEIRTLAADASSRTSVQLARVVLERKYGCRPVVTAHQPDLEEMLHSADAALIIGDPALRIDPARLPYHVYDLGAEWAEMTGLPMVFAVWAGRPGISTPEVVEAFQASLAHGRQRMDEIVTLESAQREFAPELVRHYLTRNIVHELGPGEYAGMERFLEWASALDSDAGLTRAAASPILK
jgi:chorismate dehydratase